MRIMNKKILLTTSAIIAMGSLGLSSSVHAQDITLPQNGVTTSGVVTIDDSQATSGILDIDQHTAVASIDWDSFNIGLNASVTFNQLSSTSIIVNKVVGAGIDPTQILGRLSANGMVMVLDGNGVFFGNNSQVDASGLLVSTGDIQNFNDVLLGAAPVLANFGNGTIENNGVITIADYGLAAFAGATVINNGTITAHRGRISMAGGDTLTLDLFGDGLLGVNVGNPASLIVNNGIIDASAMNTIINDAIYVENPAVALASVVGGRIILTADNVEVNGTIKSDGQEGGGQVVLLGDNVSLESTGVITANSLDTGNGGEVYINGTTWAEHKGLIEAKGGTGGDGGLADIGATQYVGYIGHTDLDGDIDGTLTISSTSNIYLRNDDLTNLSYIVAASLANSMESSNVQINASDKFVVAKAVDLSVWDNGIDTGMVTNSLGIFSRRMDIQQDITIGSGQYNLDIGTINLDAKLLYRVDVGSTPVIPNINVHNINITTNASRVNVRNDNALISQAAILGGDNSKIYVAAGTYYDSVGAFRTGQRFFGANAWVAADGSSRGAETVVVGHPGFASFGVFADNVEINGFEITSGQAGVYVLNDADNTVIKYNNIHDQVTPEGSVGSSFAILSATESDNISIIGNWLHSSDYGIYAFSADGIKIKNNLVSDLNYDGINLANMNNASVKTNIVQDTGRYGIIRHESGDNTEIRGNFVINTGSHAIYNNNGSNAKIVDNNINNGAVGIYVYNTTNDLVMNNTITGTSSSGIYMRDSDSLYVKGNNITSSGISGIATQSNTNSTYQYNDVDGTVWPSFSFANETNAKIRYNNSLNSPHIGFSISGGSNVSVRNNTVKNFGTGAAGISAYQVDNITIKYNDIEGTGNMGIQVTDVTGDAYIEYNEINRRQSDFTNALTGDGILVDNTDYARIKNNYVSYVNGDGIKVLNSDGVKVDNNSSFSVLGNGVYLDGVTSSYVRNNLIDTISGYGVDYNVSGASVSGNVFSFINLADINTH